MALSREPARNDDELIRYLLGELTEDEAERLDERSIVDDEFAARLRLAEDDLVDAYARGRLTGDRRKRFESFYMASPRRREKAAFARRLLDAVEGDVRRREPVHGVSRDRRPAAWLPWAIAATLALGAGSGWLFVREARLRATLGETERRLADADRRATALATELAAQQRATAAAQTSLAQARAPQPVASVALVLLPQTRGVGPVPLVAVGADSLTVPIELAVEGADRSPYDAALRDPATNAIVWRSGPLTIAHTRSASLLPVAVPAAFLKSQHYAMDVFARRSGGTHDFVGSYAFEVVRR